MNLVEVQLDRIVGPTHHFGGLGIGNLASMEHAGQISNPKAAALQGLDKMRTVARLGVPQFILPPQTRPDLEFLRSIGFRGDDADVLRRVADHDPGLLSAASSCSAMWTANAATVTPGVDSGDAMTHVTVANLVASVHRAIEPSHTGEDLQRVLAGACRLHRPVGGGVAMRDEGAANHMRFGSGKVEAGANVFVYGDGDPAPRKHWPRQSRRACEAVARLHALPTNNTFFLKQHPSAIDAGAFHNDVVAMSHQNLLIHHQLAFDDPDGILVQIADAYLRLTGIPMVRIVVGNETLSLEDAVGTYLFNSQIVSAPERDLTQPIVIAASQVAEHPAARALVDGWIADGIFSDARFVELGQSMWGGGGPACLRLRIPMPETGVDAMSAGCRWSEALHEELREVISAEYESRLQTDDLARIEFYREAERARRRIEACLMKKKRVEQD